MPRSLYALFTYVGHAQNNDDRSNTTKGHSHCYRLEFVLKEVNADGKAANTRSFETSACSGRNELNGSIRTGTRIPVSVNDREMQYVDVGVNVDVQRLEEGNNRLSIYVMSDVSSIAPEGSGPSTTSRPVIRQNRWNARVLIPVGKPTTVFSSDHLDDKGKTQVEITATLLQ